MYVQCSRPYSSVFESCCEGVFIDKSASSSVDEEGSRSHLLDGVLINEMVVVFVQCAVQGDAVALVQKFLQHKQTFMST